MFSCNLPPALLAEWPGFFTCYCGNTGGGTDTEIRVSTESRPWRRKFSRRSSRDSNPRPFNHESGALTTELSPPPTDRRPPRFFIPPFLRHISNTFFSYHFSLYMYLSVSSCNISNRLASEKSCLIVPQHYCCKRSNICMCCFGCSVNQWERRWIRIRWINKPLRWLSFQMAWP